MFLIKPTPDASLYVSGKGKKLGSFSFSNGGCLKSAETRFSPGLYAAQWGLFIKMATDWQVSEVGDTCRAAAGPGRRRSVQIEWLSAGTAHLGFPALLSVPHLLSREKKMNRCHWAECWSWIKSKLKWTSVLPIFEKKGDISIYICVNVNFSKGKNWQTSKDDTSFYMAMYILSAIFF